MNYEVRAMSFAEILDTALRLVTDHFLLLAGLMAVANLPVGLLGLLLTPDIPATGEQMSPDEASAFFTGAAGAFLATVLAFSILYPIALSATTHAIADSYRGRQITFGEALSRGTRNLGPLVGTWVLMTLIIAVGFICLIIPGIYLALSLLAVWPIMIVEKIYGMNAIRRSRTLMADNLMRALGILVVIGLLGGVLGAAAGLALGWIPIVGSLANPLIQSASGAFGAAAQMVLYFDIRCRKEGFDIEHLAERVALQTGTDA